MGYLRRPLAVVAAFLLLVPLAVLLGYRMPELMAHAEQLHYRDGIVAARETPYQRVVVTDHGVPGHPAYGRGAPRAETLAEAGGLALRRVRSRHAALCREDIRLYINGGLQFSTCDEHRYHEMLVHPALGLVNDPREVLVLGGGDGLAVRELLKYAGLRIRLVELDAAIVRLFRDDPRFARLNGGALADPRVNVTVGDAFRFLRETRARYDLIVMDFPDPYQSGTARLYSTQFFRFAGRALAPGGILVTQSTSPLFHPRAFLSIRKTMEAAGFRVVSLQVPMLAFEHWGFQVGSRKAKPGAMKERLEAFTPAVPTRYLNRDAVQAAHRWGKGFERPPAEIPVNDQFTLPLAELYRETLRR
jgi:predicted membrane-bound spermidine synthase